ncbi:DUF4166 domain-containing protein [Microbacterium sp. SA39]|uniref:DUF4166 domain-containing protein n=1 Tax=Microbacterium sp. SA39 TaxID=1263625 RepID=UPI0005FA5BFA|nr:DUF4166 domain-containing protein [Microbacterium sp. SA39]KJQ54532.1 hypothetical protein RS85_01685 [Microbacterium sp. SA39]
MIARGEVFLRALGEDAQRLHPEILTQMQAVVPADRAEGVFAVAGSRFGQLGALALPVVGSQMLVTRFGRDVPFTLSMRAERDALGRPTLDTTREFRFPGSAQRITDRLTTSVVPGLVRNLLGARGRVELIEECSVTDEGALRMQTRRIALRLGGRRFALRGILGISVDLEDGWDEVHGRRTISMRARHPLLGTVLEYRGWYRLIDSEGVPASS